MSKSFQKEKAAIAFELAKQESSVVLSKDDPDSELNDKSNRQNLLSRAYDILLTLFNDLSLEFKQSKLENSRLKNQLDEMNKSMDKRSTIQCTDDISTNKTDDTLSKQHNTGDIIYKRSLSDRWLSENNSSKVLMNTEISDVNLGYSCKDKSDITTILNSTDPTKLERDIKLLYEQCTAATPHTDSCVFISNVISLSARLLRMEKCSIILQDVIKKMGNDIHLLQKEITEKNLLIEQFKLCGLDTNFKSTKSSDTSNNLDVSHCEQEEVQILKHNLIIEKIKCDELKKEIEMLHQHLENIKSCLKSRDQELKQHKDNSITAILEQQSQQFKEDFLQERSDREKAHSRILELELEKNNHLQKMQILNKFLENYSKENTIMKEELEKVKTFHSIILNLKQENQILKNQLKVNSTQQTQSTTSHIQPNSQNWACPFCTFLNDLSQRSCVACQKYPSPAASKHS